MVKKEGYYYKPSKPKKATGGIKAHTRRGEIGSKWWSRKLIDVLKSYGWESRLSRGARYARAGQVIKINIDKGRVEAYVQGSRSRPYHIKIEFPVISEEQWKNIFKMLEEHKEVISELLNGNVPLDLEDLLETINTSLFIKKPEDIEMSCTCPDYAVPCKHIAAVFYILAENFDTDPFLMLLLRGKDKQEIMSAVSNTNESFGAEKPEIAHDTADLYTFWSGNDTKTVKIDLAKSNPLARYPLPDELNDPEIMAILSEYYSNIKKGAEKLGNKV